MGEIDQLDDAIDHGVAQCNECVHKTKLEPIDDLLKEQNRIVYQASQQDVDEAKSQQGKNQATDNPQTLLGRSIH